MDTITPTVVSMPIPVREMKYRRSAVLSPRRKAEMIVAAITRIAQTVDSRPTENPERIVVAGPVWEDSAISFTGFRLVEV